MKMLNKFKVLIMLLVLLSNFLNAESYDKADNITAQKAKAHYSRARILFLNALKEFDKGVKIASPGSLMNAQSFREDIVSNIKELEKVLSPKARVTRDGISFSGNSDFLVEAK